ncbi:phosphatidylinositol 4-kinase gamma 2-like [Prunus dulcis]|uniref:phosphatidylinositol 4-kinase gamma 2-like n=1 Tax=Prunus dulcis TaxID=3755 RepID=UPI001482A606|nr:phosphatidylinositol 4-kinase gamma 2-like [Prunus dulcis]
MGLNACLIELKWALKAWAFFLISNTVVKHTYYPKPNAGNNPNGLAVSQDGEGLKRGTRVGEGALREVAAYILDHPNGRPRNLSSEAIGFAGVPLTVLVKCLHKGFNYSKGYEGSLKNVKIGSLQMFMKNDGSCEDMGPSRFPVEEVHKISVFDLRMANAEWHAGNTLFRKGEAGQTLLIPIDHGYCLPENVSKCVLAFMLWYLSNILNVRTIVLAIAYFS